MNSESSDKEQKFSVSTVRDVLLAAKTVFHLYQNMSESAWDERYGNGTSFEQALDQEFDRIGQSLPSATLPTLTEARRLIERAGPLAEQNTQEWVDWCVQARAWCHEFDKTQYVNSLSSTETK